MKLINLRFNYIRKLCKIMRGIFLIYRLRRFCSLPYAYKIESIIIKNTHTINRNLHKL